MVIQDTPRSSRLQCKGSIYLFYFKTLSNGPAPGMEPATSRSAVKRSTDWANPAAVSKNPTRFGFHSPNRQRNLTPVSNVCEAAVRSLFWTPTGFNELPEVWFELPFNMIGELALASLTGQSWRVLKSWYGRPRTLLDVSCRGLVTLRLQRRLRFHCRDIIRVSCSSQPNWVCQDKQENYSCR